MKQEEIAILKHISNTLDKILEKISEPQSKLSQLLNSGATVVGVLGIIAVIDIILSWIRNL